MFTNTDDKRNTIYARMIGVTDEQFREFTKRAAHFVRQSPTPSRLRASFFILREIIERDKETQKATLQGIGKNPVLLKYGVEIIELWHDGLGSRAIVANLQKFHGQDAKISRSTIDRFLAANGLKRGQ